MAVTDQSTSGGRHILVPLAIGTTATLAEITHLMRLLEARLPSLDKTPMTNPKTGCITVPGSACREGGHRTLDGDLPPRSKPSPTAPTRHYSPGSTSYSAHSPLGHPTSHNRAPAPQALTGAKQHTRLRPEYIRTTELPGRITAYATTGQLPLDTTWPSHSEARQSVLAHAALHGHSLATIQALIAPGRPWHAGLGAAYTRYGHHAQNALQRDWHKALTWAATNTQFFRPVRAQEVNAQGGQEEGLDYIEPGWRARLRG